MRAKPVGRGRRRPGVDRGPRGRRVHEEPVSCGRAASRSIARDASAAAGGRIRWRAASCSAATGTSASPRCRRTASTSAWSFRTSGCDTSHPETERQLHPQQVSRSIAIRGWMHDTTDHVAFAGRLEHHVRSASGTGFVLVGDAIEFIDPLTGEGLHRAFVSAELAAERSPKRLRGDPNALADYDRRIRARWRSKNVVSWVLQAFLSQPGRVRLRAPAACRSRHGLREQLTLVLDRSGAGERGDRPALPAAAAGAVTIEEAQTLPRWTRVAAYALVHRRRRTASCLRESRPATWRRACGRSPAVGWTSARIPQTPSCAS